jgi:hypothetical protein
VSAVPRRATEVTEAQGRALELVLQRWLLPMAINNTAPQPERSQYEMRNVTMLINDAATTSDTRDTTFLYLTCGLPTLIARLCAAILA